MRASRRTRPAAGLERVDVPVPVVDPADTDDVRVEVRAAGLCGSEPHVDDRAPSDAFVTRSIPVTVGPEFVGVARHCVPAPDASRDALAPARAPALLAERSDDAAPLPWLRAGQAEAEAIARRWLPSLAGSESTPATVPPGARFHAALPVARTARQLPVDEDDARRADGDPAPQ